CPPNSKGCKHFDSIKVFVRVRPLTQGTGLTTDGDQALCLTVTSPNTIRLHSKPEPRTFTYDHVADMDTSQDSVFSSVAKNIVESCMNGYNGTIFAYGQTGSGKTFTMLGPSDFDNFTDELRGVIPRSFEYLFFLINREVERSGNTKSFLCKCAFIEIYNEQIYDLLDSASPNLFLRENIKKGVFVEGAVEKIVTSAAEAYQVLSMGWRNRRVASTSMNRESSRSHAVFTMTLESKESVNEVVNIRMSQLNLVDLAGSERQRDTHTEGSRLKEASSINRSLMCLGQVIMALVDVSNGKNRHICYRDSKLTFLLRDSLGGNAKTYIIANVHPGSKCFGETLSTLQFAQRAKLIKNKAMINEDTQGNVRQLQAEVKKLKEQLAQALSSQGQMMDSGRDVAPGGPQLSTGERAYMTALLISREDEKKMLLQKVAQLEDAWAQKEKFIHSSRMIVKFREDHISRLEKKLKGGQSSDEDSQALIDQLKEEIKILKDQIEHHPKMTRYAAENYSLREENRHLRSLESVRRAEEAAGQAAAEGKHEVRQGVSASEKGLVNPAYSTPVTAESVSTTSMERLKAQLLQKQSELTATIQAFEEYKEVTKKQMTELESEKRYLDKSNRHLENILEATNAHKKQELSQLNRIHVETIKILTTPTKSYNLRSRVVPFSSPEHLNGTAEDVEDIRGEQPPPEMTELACEALTEELRQVQEQASRVQTQLDEEELKSNKLTQQITKLEEQILLSTEQSNRNKEQLSLQETIDNLQRTLQSEKQAGEVLKSEICDLRLVLQSSDKELAAVKTELKEGQSQQQKEMSQISSSMISTQLQLDKVQLEWEQLLEQHRTLQDSFDQLQAEAKFEADQARQQLQDRQQEIDHLKAEVTVEVLQEEVAYATEEVERLTKVLDEQNSLLQASQEQTAQKEVTIQNLQQKLESRRSSMVTMEILLAELNAERAAKNEEIQRLKVHLCGLPELFVGAPIIHQAQESVLAQSQTCIQQLTTELRNRCLELRELSEREQDQEKLLQEVEVLRKQVVQLSEENGKLVGHKNHKQRIEYLVKLKKDNTKLHEVGLIFLLVCYVRTMLFDDGNIVKTSDQSSFCISFEGK
uniref:Kinesin family member 15 n=1 Tax=Myripristis murdjan TaxID=586833 RepID=A0A668AT42_9TELE